MKAHKLVKNMRSRHLAAQTHEKALNGPWALWSHDEGYGGVEIAI